MAAFKIIKDNKLFRIIKIRFPADPADQRSTKTSDLRKPAKSPGKIKS